MKKVKIGKYSVSPWILILAGIVVILVARPIQLPFGITTTTTAQTTTTTRTTTTQLGTTTTTTTLGECNIATMECGYACTNLGGNLAQCDDGPCPSGMTNIGDYACSDNPPCDRCCCNYQYVTTTIVPCQTVCNNAGYTFYNCRLDCTGIYYHVSEGDMWCQDLNNNPDVVCCCYTTTTTTIPVSCEDFCASYGMPEWVDEPDMDLGQCGTIAATDCYPYSAAVYNVDTCCCWRC